MPNWLKTVFICMACLSVWTLLESLVLVIAGKRRQEKQKQEAKT